MADTVNRVGIEIDAKTTGGAGLRDQIANINDLKDVSSRFMAIQSAGAEKYPDSLKKQNQYYKEQIDLVKQLETSASKDRLDALKGERDDIIKRQQRSGTEHERQALIVEKNQVLQNLYNEEQVREHASREDARARRDRTAWAREQGLGAYGDRPEGPGFERDMMTRLAAGDLGGVAQAGVGRGMAGMATRFGGMSTMAKMGLGAGAGVLGLGAYKLISGLAEGWTGYKELAPEMLALKTMSGNMGGEGLLDNLLTGMSATGATAQEQSQLMQTWQRGGGLSTMGRAETDAMTRTIQAGQAYNIGRGESVDFTTQMARTGMDIGAMNETVLKRTIQDGLSAGIEVSRLPEYLDQVSQVTDAVLQTAVAFNPDALLALTADIASLGLPFQGERGGQVISGLHGALTQQGGMGFEAARRVAETRFGPGGYELFDIQSIQQGGLSDPDLLQEYLNMTKQMAGGNVKTQASILALNTDISARQWYNADIDPETGMNPIDSILEKLQAGVPTGLDAIETGDVTERLKELLGTTEYQRAQADAMIAAVEIKSSATLFATASERFIEGVIEFSSIVAGNRLNQFISPTLQVSTTPDAVANRILNTYGTAKSKGLGTTAGAQTYAN